MLNSFDTSPKQAGIYEINIEGVLSFMPFTLEFDGKTWLGLENLQKRYKDKKLKWFDKPLGNIKYM